VKNSDGLNVYTDKKDIYQGCSREFLQKSEGDLIIEKQKEVIKALESNNKPKITDVLLKTVVLILFLTNTSQFKESFVIDDKTQIGLIAFAFLMIVAEYVLG
jgi:hypothetical protein